LYILSNNLYVDETVEKINNYRVIPIKYYYRDFMKKIARTMLNSEYTDEEIELLKKYIKYCIDITNQKYLYSKYVVSYIFKISKQKNLSIELLNICTHDAQEEMRIRNEGDRHIIYNLEGKISNKYNLPIIEYTNIPKALINYTRLIDPATISIFCGLLIVCINTIKIYRK